MKRICLLYFCAIISFATAFAALPVRSSSTLKQLRSTTVAKQTASIKSDETTESDTPLSPENLRISLSDDYKTVTLTWDAVGEIGEHGGHVNLDDVVYYIFDAFGSYYDPAIAYTKETSYTFDFSDIIGQDFVAYQVTACVDDYNASLATVSEIVAIGTPDKLPYHESFARENFTQAWVINPASSGSVLCGIIDEYETLTTYDNDGGFFLAMPNAKNASYGFYSAKIDIKGATAPVYQLFYQGNGAVVEMSVGVDGQELSTVNSINLKENPAGAWTLATVDLTPYKDATYIQIGIMIRGDRGTYAAIDNVRVIDQTEKKLRIAAVDAPTEVAAGMPVNVAVTLENVGTTELKNISATLTGANSEFKDAIEVLTVNSCSTLQFTIPTSAVSPAAATYTITAIAESEIMSAGNTSTFDVKVKFPKHPAPTNLTANGATSCLALSWDAPDFKKMTLPRNVEEDFENPEYESFAFNNIGDWTMVDNDGLKTYTFLGDTNNPYRTQPMAFQLFETKASGMNEEAYIDAEPFSGERMLVAWSASKQNDNWLISPLLSGHAQTISFRAKSFTVAWPESFEVLYSTTDKNLESFVRIENVENYPEDNIVAEFWLEYKAALPEGARYFAIRHNSYDTYALFVDDIYFEASGELPVDTELIGYNVFVDDNLSCELEKSTSANIQITESGRHSARVSAVYNNGESRACEAVEADVETSGLENISIESAITLDGHTLSVTAAHNTPVKVFSANGNLILRVTCDALGHFETTLAPGLYIVSAGSACRKLVVL